MSYVIEVRLLDTSVEAELNELTYIERAKYLFVEAHPDYPTYFRVNALDPLYFKDFSDILGAYQVISIWKIQEFYDRVQELGYKLIFITDPRPYFDLLDSLDQPYPYQLNFDLKDFQLRGFNYLKDKQAAICEWSTGTGKSVYACARAKYLYESSKIDTIVIVAKAGNRINWVRQLKSVANIEGELIGFRWNSEKEKYSLIPGNTEAKRTARAEQYKSSNIFVTNYEKFRDDELELIAALKGKRVYFVWDEMPTKLKTRSTQIWKGTNRVIRSCKETYHDLLSATKVENSPEDVFNCVKLMDKKALDARVADFRAKYASSFNRWAPGQVETWNTLALQELGMRLSHMTHRASKYSDPEIAAQFPKEHIEDILIEMSSEDWKLYEAVRDQIISEFWSGVGTNHILSRMAVLRQICNNPWSINLSGGDMSWAIKTKKPPTDKYCQKLAYLKDDLNTIPGKVVLFSAFNDLGAKMLTKYLVEWGHEFVLYDGTSNKKQEAEDRFKRDPNIKVFVSSDQGSDSINLEVAQTTINYDLPWLYSRYLQRINRQNRITSKDMCKNCYRTRSLHEAKLACNSFSGVENVFVRNYKMVNTIEERIELIMLRKKSYADAIDGITDAQMEAISALSKQNLWFILTGQTSR